MFPGKGGPQVAPGSFRAFRSPNLARAEAKPESRTMG
jgi:hypothetical protein